MRGPADVPSPATLKHLFGEWVRRPGSQGLAFICVVVKIMVPFLVTNIVRHLLFRVPIKGHYNFDKYPYGFGV